MLLFSGNVAAANPQPFGDGLRCASGVQRRLCNRRANPAGQALWGPGVAPPGIWLPGQTFHFQAIHRDPGTPCAHGFDTTSQIELLLGP